MGYRISVSAFGGLVHIHADKRGVQPKQFIVSEDYKEYIESKLLWDQGFRDYPQAFLLKINREINNQNNHSKLMELKEISSEGIESFSKELDIKKHAELTKLSRDIKLSLNGENEDHKLMELIQETERAGSLCTRIMGTGAGEFLYHWAPEYKHQAIKDKINIKTWVKGKNKSTVVKLCFRNGLVFLIFVWKYN